MMKSIEKTLEYHELLMVKNDLNDLKFVELPEGFHFEFWNSMDDLND